MKHAMSLLSTLFISWPAMVAGYMWEHVVIGFERGQEVALDDGLALCDKLESWVKKATKDQP